MMGMVYEPSKLHHLDGIFYRGHSLTEIQERAPKTVKNGAPNPEGIFWLLMTGEYPTEQQLNEFKQEFVKRGHLT